jgi:gluconokinase
MGVSGSGKSTFAAALARALPGDLGEGDDLHPPANVARMRAGQPLTDADREPWLQRVRAWIDERLAAGHDGVITCSALRRRYRDELRADGVLFAFLDGPRAVLAERLAGRSGHFMPASLLDSQLATLEPPGPDEHAVTVPITVPIDQQVALVLTALGRFAPGE